MAQASYRNQRELLQKMRAKQDEPVQKPVTIDVSFIKPHRNRIRYAYLTF